ncbi:hypothetical protein AB0395_18925 [Streptosporangium sp. NPDC051023]|uniref:hypothetical protein n=1 Tax=Streptosporangium sp. NPDC051023 TaxID=3155410 RepID=UPI00344E5A2C
MTYDFSVDPSRKPIPLPDAVGGLVNLEELDVSGVVGAAARVWWPADRTRDNPGARRLRVLVHVFAIKFYVTEIRIFDADFRIRRRRTRFPGLRRPSFVEERRWLHSMFTVCELPLFSMTLRSNLLFVVAEMPREAPPIAYIDSQSTEDRVSDRPEEVKSLICRHGVIRADALPRRESLGLIKETMRRWTI